MREENAKKDVENSVLVHMRETQSSSNRLMKERKAQKASDQIQ